MERNIQFEKDVRLETLRQLYKIERMLKQNKLINKKATAYIAKYNGSLSAMMSRGITTGTNRLLKDIRMKIDALELPDPLKYRQTCQWARPCKYFIRNSEIRGAETFNFDSSMFWVDDFIKAMREDNRPHTKGQYFRINNDFYDKSEYLFYEADGKAYSKKEYAINEKGKLVELSKCIEICSNGHESYYGQKQKFTNSNWLMCPEDEKFEHIPQIGGNWIFKIKFYESDDQSYYGQFINRNFFWTLFRFGKKRYFGKYVEDSSPLFVTKEMLMEMEYAPTDEHKRVWHDIYEKLMCHKKKYGINSCTTIKDNGEGVSFVLEVNDSISSQSIMGKVIKAICDDDRRHLLTLGGLLKRLDALKQLYKTEAKYDKSAK